MKEKSLSEFSQENKSLFAKLLLIAKIVIIAYFSLYLIGNFNPYYETQDGYTIATMAIQISQGHFTITNELLQETGREEFVPGNWLITPDKKSVFPLGDVGFRIIPAVFYSIAGNFALFYLGPVLGITFLVLTERFTTKFFGKYVGLLTLLFLTTNHLLFRSFTNLQTEVAFMIFFILGCYSLLSFYKIKKSYFVLLTSVFFVIGTLIRINGIIYFPIEIILIIFFLIYYHRTQQQITLDSSHKVSKIKLQFNIKSISKIFIYALIPWIIFLIFWFAYHDYFFDDPLTNRRITEGNYGEDSNISSLITLNEKDIDNSKQFSKYFLPYQFPATFNKLDNKMEDILGKEWLGLIAFITVIVMILISLLTRDKRLEIVTFTLFIFATLWFYSAVTTQARAELGVPGRYMIPAFTLYYLILSYYVVRLYNWSGKTFSKKNRIFSTSKKIVIISVLTIFFTSSFYFIPPTQAIINGNFDIQNPFEYSLDHPPNSEGLSKINVILAGKSNQSLEYDVIHFKIIMNENNLMKEESIELLRNILNKDYDVFIFKEPTTKHEKGVLKDLTENHGFVLLDHSDSFCQIKHISNLKPNEETKSNSECF